MTSLSLNVLIMKSISKIFLISLISHFFLMGTLQAKKIKDSRIKMLNGEYAKLSDFNKNGPMIINFWTTW